MDMNDIVASSSSALASLSPPTPPPVASAGIAAPPVRAPQARPAIGARAVTNVALYPPSFLPQYDPLSPNADADGLVSGADVDVSGASLDEILALRSYRANLATLRTAD